MPIAIETVPELIKIVQEKKLPTWLTDYFEAIAKNLQVHTKGQLFTKVESVYPNENADSRAHCLATYEPITKSSIWKGINNLLRIFSNSSFTINVGDDLNEWLKEYEYDGHNLLNYFLEMWVHKGVAEDPNGLFVIYPPDYAEEKNICPVQFVRSELIRYVGPEQVAFISEHDSEVSFDVEECAHHREVFYDEKVKGLNALTYTKTTYNKRLKIKVVKPVVHIVSKDGLLIYNEGENKIDYKVVQFAEPLSVIPAFTAGGPLLDRSQLPIFESFVTNFIPFGNLSLLQHRNHRAVDLMFSYPRIGELETPCDCQAGMKKYGDKYEQCRDCNGSQFRTVQSAYKTYRRKYDPNDEGENAHLKVDPVSFYSPDVSIIDYSKNAWKDYLKMAEEAIFVQQRVQTGNVESAESKSIDREELYAWLLNISKVLYNNIRIVLQSLEDYIARSPIKVSVEKPYSFAILTEEEAFVALNILLNSDAPVFVKGNTVDNFVNKFVSKTSPVVRAYAILKQYDTLLFYSTKDVQTFKGANTISAEMWTKHILGYPVLLKLYEQDRTIFDKSNDEIMALIDTEIATFKIGSTTNDLRITLQDEINNPAA